MDVCDLIDGRGIGLWDNVPAFQYRYKLLDVCRTVPKGGKNSLIWLLADCLRTNDVDKLKQKWLNLKKILPELGHSVYQEAWIQLMGMMYRNIKEDSMSVELTRDIVYPHVTEDDVDGFLDAEGNVINWRQRCLDQGRAEGRLEERAEMNAKREKQMRQALRFKYGELPEAQLKTILHYLDRDDFMTLLLQAASGGEFLELLQTRD